MNMTYELVRKLMDYDPHTGVFLWRERSPDFFNYTTNPVRMCNTWNTKCRNKVVGFKNRKGYIELRFFKRTYFLHRLAFLYMEGYLPENQVDHINRIRDDNRWCNLRVVSQQCNSRNCGLAKNNKTGVTGVYFSKKDKRWVAKIKVNYKSIDLGGFINFNDAVQSRWDAEVKYGFPNCNTTSTAYNYLKNNGGI